LRSAEAALDDLERPDSEPLARVYLIYGTESYYHSRLVRAIKARTVEPSTEAFNYAFFEHQGATPGAVRGAALTPPMMAACRLVVVRDPEDIVQSRGDGSRGENRGDEDAGRAAAEADGERFTGSPGGAGEDSDTRADSGTPLPPGQRLEPWMALLEEIPAGTRLVMTLSVDLPATSALIKAAAKLKPPADVIRCLEATPKTAEVWVRRIAAELGGVMDHAASQALVMRSGTSLAVLEQEIKKLLSYVAGPGDGDPDRPRVTTEDVIAAATPSAEASVFEMVDHIGSRRSHAAVMSLRRLVEQGEPPLRLLAMVTRQVRLVLLTREMLAEGAPVRDIEARLRLPTWVVRNYLAQARSYGREQLVDMMRALARIDLDVKTGRQDPATALELFILHAAATPTA